ncbi:MAG: beta-aspartyl-peptidase [Sphaerochaetaceae bacterium]|nr:beta-aspartyl-peptidase [Spirochaetales bacterium]MDY5500786.1 beta-aspartyl-peptidase [Sphaerochaetaceae bacterium]
MTVLLRDAHVCAPEDKGVQDILIVGDRIVAMEKKLDVRVPGLEVIDMQGALVIPGLIDQHVHIIGGGGEDGCASRVPPLEFSDCAKAGVTSLVGTLGTDSHTRTIRDLLAKTMSLNHDGVTAHCLTGAYEYPSPTLTGNVADDLVFCEPIIGCKLAISDHRCSCPTTDEIIRLASQVRLGGLIGGKVGELHIHVGADDRGIEQLFEIQQRTILPVTQFRPTHMGRHLEQAQKWCEMGGYTDITSGKKSADAIVTLLSRLDSSKWNLVTMSSDSNGSFPKWNDKREIIGMDRGRMTSLIETIRDVVEKGVPLEAAVSLSTSHVADALKFKDQGRIQPGCVADLAFMDGWEVSSVMAKGQWLMRKGNLVKTGMFGD